MVDPQTWSWVFSTVAHVYGVLLGLFAIMIIFTINFIMYMVEKTDVKEGAKEVLKELGLFSKRALILTGFSLIISILMLSLGNSVNYYSVLFWAFGVLLPIIVISILLWFVYVLIEAITMSWVTKPEKQRDHKASQAGKNQGSPPGN